MAENRKCFLRKLQADPGVGACNGPLNGRDSLTIETVRLLKIRSGCRKSMQHVCQAHYTKFLKVYECAQKSCCLHPSDAGTGPASKKRKLGPRTLNNITLSMRDKAKIIELQLVPGKKICLTCKVDLFKRIKKKEMELTEKNIEIPTATSSPSVQSSQPPSLGGGDGNTPKSDSAFKESLDGLNKWLSSLGFTPVSEKKLNKQKSYGDKVMKKIRAALSKYSEEHLLEDQNAADFKEVIDQLKEFIANNPEHDKKMLALSVVPKSWSYPQIVETFGPEVTMYMARKNRTLVEQNGILFRRGPRKGQTLSEATVEKVLNFYCRDDISRPLPGSKDVVTVREKGKRVKKTKRLVLSTLSSLHQKYIEEHPENKVSLGKFCELRPKECVLAGSAGTHIICVCTYHQNPQLMFEAGNLKEAGFESIKECRDMLLCPDPGEECFFRTCQNCPSTSNLQEALEVHFDSEMISSVTYNQWESTDRSNIITHVKTTEDFISEFIAQLKILLPHHCISKMQANYYKTSIENLEEGEVVVNLDFAENFSFVVQSSSQGMYFNNKQATIHPCMIYYKDAEGNLCKSSYVLISNHMEHTTAAVHTFQRKLVKHIKENLKINVKKIKYFSDGCAAQYKNRKAAANVWFHEKDFGVPAEWHFYATSHGKTACDGLGGMIKHTTMLHCLRLTATDPQITTARAFFEWVDSNIKGVKVEWVSTEEVKANEVALRVRLETAFEIGGILDHTILPRSGSRDVIIKLNSHRVQFKVRKSCTKEFELDFSDVQDFITFTEDEQSWSLGCVSESNEEDETFTIEVLKPTGEPRTFQFTDSFVVITLHDIVTLVAPYFQNKGRIVKLRVQDVKAADVKLKSR